VSDPLEGPKLKIERANAHVAEIRQIIAAFLKTDTYKITVETNPGKGQQIFKIAGTQKPPTSISIVSGEILYQLRSALDHLVTCVATKRGITFKKTGFPIESERDIFVNTIKKRKIEQRLPVLARVLTELKPYKGGNDLLWWLHWLNSIDKHQILVAVASANVQWEHDLEVSVPLEFAGHLERDLRIPGRWQSLHEEPAVLFTTPLGTKVKGKSQIEIAVVFGDIETAQPYEVFGTLQQLIDLTRGIVKIFEDRFFKS
jgi:hypothetical protein